MRLLFRLIKAVIFLLLLGFALKNTDGVVLRYFFGFEWHTPLVFVLFAFFGIGLAAGFIASLAVIARQRRETLALKRALRGAARHAQAPFAPTAESL